MSDNPRAIRLAYCPNNDAELWCFVCAEPIHDDYWHGDVSHLADHDQHVAICSACMTAGELRSKLAAKADKLSEKLHVARELAANLIPPTADEIREATVVPDLPFSANRVSDEVFGEWLKSRKAAAVTVNANTCEIHQVEPNSFYVRSRNMGSDTRGWIHENDLSPHDAAIVRERVKPRAPAPYSERDRAPVPF
jgi:hypothetical protein